MDRTLPRERLPASRTVTLRWRAALADLSLAPTSMSTYMPVARCGSQNRTQVPWVPLLTPSLVDITGPRIGNYRAQQGQLLIDHLWVQ